MSADALDRDSYERGVLLDAIALALPDHMRPDPWDDLPATVAGLVAGYLEVKAALAETRAALADATGGGVAKLARGVAQREGYADALSDIDEQMANNIGIPPRDRWQYLAGWIDGRRAGL